MNAPALNALKVSLPQRVPTEPIAARIWRFWFDLGAAQYDLSNALSQVNQCVRSRLGETTARVNRGLGVEAGLGADAEFTSERTTSQFPYPKRFREVFEMRQRAAAAPAAPAGGGQDEEARAMPAEYQPDGVTTQWETSRGLSIYLGWFGVERESVKTIQVTVRPVYVVLGIFKRGHADPLERVVFVAKPQQLFWRLQWAVFRLRDWRSTSLSLRHVKGFRLYKCDPKRGIHERVDLDSAGVADLQLLVATYKQWHVSKAVTQAWADWIHQTLNNTSQDVLEGTYSVEIVLDWSVNRISVVVLLPVLLSLAIGLWLNSKDWTDLATIQTAWGTASYIVSAGGW
ncbi:hypothetical protein DL767_001019 [Monosporascus sp. MG133]|nr:hypothetical protein DL767_001019 [Monosporascus sp. MG133]